MMTKDLSKLFSPRSVAVIGASRSQKKLGSIVLRNIITAGFKGSIYPVNPNAETVQHLKCYPDIASLPDVPELAVVAIPSAFVIDTIHELGKKGTKNAVVFAAGFKEIGHEGAKLEAKLVETAKKYEINLLGPNCLGFVNNIGDINATFSHLEKHVGNLRFLSQSGAIASSVFDWAQSMNLGFSEFITLGNKACLSENDVLSYWLHDKSEIAAAKEFYLKDKRLSKVAPIGMYLESIEEGEDFLNTVSQLSLHHPVFLLKPGKSKAAKKAMQSHTGAIAGEDSVLDAALDEASVIRCEGIEDMFDLAQAFSWENAPVGPNVAIVSNAGGPAVISSDFVESEGLNLVEIEPKVKERLQKYLPKEASLLNPIDVLGDAFASRYASAIDIILGQTTVNALIVILTPQIMTEIYLTAEFISRLSSVHKKPIICAFMGGADVEKGERVLHMHKIPTFRYPERAVKALGKMWKWKKNSLDRAISIKRLTQYMPPIHSDTADLVRINEIFEISRRQNSASLNNFEANEVLKSWGIHTPPSDVVTDFERAYEFVQEHDFPVVLKISAPGLLHKKDIGGVIAHIDSKAKLDASLKIMQETIHGLPAHLREHSSIQIQKEVLEGIEVIIGVKKDKHFGHVLMFGAGGTYAEVIQDRNLHLLPLDVHSAERLVSRSKIYNILKGYRGDKEYALKKLYFLIEQISELILTFPELEEFEINPVIITHDNVYAVDGKAILGN
jgi:acetyltransferase